MVVPPGYTPGRCISATELVKTKLITWSVQEKLYEEHIGSYAQKHQTATSLQPCSVARAEEDGATKAGEEEKEEEEEGGLLLQASLEPDHDLDPGSQLNPNQPQISPMNRNLRLKFRSSKDNKERAKVEKEEPRHQHQTTFQTLLIRIKTKTKIQIRMYKIYKVRRKAQIIYQPIQQQQQQHQHSKFTPRQRSRSSRNNCRILTTVRQPQRVRKFRSRAIRIRN